MIEAFVWILKRDRTVLLTDDPSPVVDGILFDRCDLPETGWGEAKAIAEAAAQELGYTVEYHSLQMTDDPDEWVA